MRGRSDKHGKFHWQKLSLKNLLKLRQKNEAFVADEEDDMDNELDDEDFGWRRRQTYSVELSESARWSSEGQPRRHSSALPAHKLDTEFQGADLSDTQNFRIFTGTWNVGGRSPQDKVKIEQWFHLTEAADIYVIGFQEIVPLSAGNVLGAEDKSSVIRWVHLIRNALNNSTCDSIRSNRCNSLSPGIESGIFRDSLGAAELTDSRRRLDPFLIGPHSSLEFQFGMPEEMLLDESFRRTESASSFRSLISDEKDLWIGGESPPSPRSSPAFTRRLLDYRIKSDSSQYALIASKKMVGIFLSVWVRNELCKYVRHVKISSVRCGLMGYLGNKGSISISLCLHRTSFCFICSHLTSGEKEGDELRRNYDVSVILKRTQFHRSTHHAETTLPDTILKHDRILWFGDLNYRLALSSTSTRMLLAKGDWETLLEKDQLHIERRAGRVFEGWHEGKICFPPTYKYRADSDSYALDKLKLGEKRRTPAWCDRVLWYGEGLKQLEYVRAESKFSDHRPVYAVFLAEVEVFGRKKLSDFLAFSEPLREWTFK